MNARKRKYNKGNLSAARTRAGKEEAVYRVCWKKVVALAVTIGLCVLMIRGCLYARRPPEQESQQEQQESLLPPDTDLIISVCDRRTGEISERPLEEYLVGVVAAEMPASFEAEALAAQAVAARTYTIRKLLRGGCKATGADVCTGSNCCQAFASTERQQARWTNTYASNHARVEAAVRATAGEILLYESEPIDALYHSASGGYTEDSENVFAAAEPYLRAVESGLETGTSRLSGTVRLPYREFCDKVNKAYADAKLKPDRLSEQIAVISRTESGRVKKIRLGGVQITGKQFRYLIGLDSAMFTVTLTGKTVRLDTKGFGHGVGLSQTGANGMAEAGADYREILLHYYTGVTIADWRTVARLQDALQGALPETP